MPETTYESWSPFVQLEWWVSDAVMLTGGLRHERGKLEVDDYTTIPRQRRRQPLRRRRFAVDVSEIMPNIGIVWEATDALKLYASYAEGYTVADIGRVLRASTAPVQRVDDLVDLQPVITDNQEIGLDYDDGRWLVHLAAYWSDSDLGSRLAFDSATQTYNVVRERTEISGFEGSVAFRFSDAGRVGLAYAQTEGRYDSDGDDRVDSRPAGHQYQPGPRHRVLGPGLDAGRLDPPAGQPRASTATSTIRESSPR